MEKTDDQNWSSRLLVTIEWINQIIKMSKMVTQRKIKTHGRVSAAKNDQPRKTHNTHVYWQFQVNIGEKLGA